MGACLVFCAAGFDTLARPVEKDDYILAADAGLRHTERLGLHPDGILGDFDSLGYVPQGAQIFPVEKDDTDAMLAARQGLALGYRDFVFYGSLDGPRLDHTVANFQMLAFLAAHGASGFLVGRDWLVTAVASGSQLRFPAAEEGILSVFCMGADAAGVTIEGLKYPLRGGTLTSAFPIGTSNHFIGAAARIAVERGCLAVVWERKLGFPERGGRTDI